MVDQPPIVHELDISHACNPDGWLSRLQTSANLESPNLSNTHVNNNGKRTEWSLIWSVIVPSDYKIGREAGVSFVNHKTLNSTKSNHISYLNFQGKL